MARYQNSVTLDDTGVIPGSYTSANIVVNSKGQIVSATDGDNGGGGINGSLDDLFDVDVSSAVAGQVLSFNGSLWISSNFDLNLLTDVTMSSPVTGDILYYNGSVWTNGPASDNNILDQNDIGTLVQGYSDNLEALSNMVGTPGIISFNGTDYIKIAIQASNNGGLTVTNGDGSLSLVSLALDLDNLVANNAISVDDEIVLNDVSAGQPTRALISDVLLAGGAITDGVNLGSGADVFILAQNGIAQFRGILSNSPGIIIGTDSDDILVGISDSLESLSLATPTAGNFLVGNGIQWVSKTVAEVKTDLNFGTMAEQDANDYLRVIGGSMAGAIDMNGFAITGLLDPVNAQDAATKDYVDNQIATGIDAGSGLTKTGNVINIVAADSSINVNTDSIELNQAFTDNLYVGKIDLLDSTVSTEGAGLVGTSVKAGLGNADTVEEALAFINNYFINSLPKFSIDLTAIWNRDVGTPNVNTDAIRDSEVAIFVNTDDSAIYADFIVPANYNTTYPLTFYANASKSTPVAGNVRFGLAYQYQRPNVAPVNYPARGPAPNWDFTDDVYASMSNNDDLIHTITWTIPANVFQPLDTVTIRFTRNASDVADTYEDDVWLFSTLLAQ